MGGRGGRVGGGVGLLGCCLTSLQQASVSQDGSAQIILRAVTLREKLQIQLSTSPSHSILTPG